MSSNLKTNKKFEFLICFFNEVYAIGLSLTLTYAVGLSH